MEMNKFVATCLFMDGEVFDQYCDAFDVDIEDEDVYEALRLCDGTNYRSFGVIILERMWAKVVERNTPVLDESKFDCDCSSPSFPSFYYDEEEVKSQADLDRIIEELDSES
jgi:hypothetical protein